MAGFFWALCAFMCALPAKAHRKRYSDDSPNFFEAADGESSMVSSVRNFTDKGSYLGQAIVQSTFSENGLNDHKMVEDSLVQSDFAAGDHDQRKTNVGDSPPWLRESPAAVKQHAMRQLVAWLLVLQW